MAHGPGNLPDWPPEADPLAEPAHPLTSGSDDTVGKGSAPSSARVPADAGTRAGQGSRAQDVGIVDFGFPFRDRSQADPAHLPRVFGQHTDVQGQQYSGYSPAHQDHTHAPTSPLSTTPGSLPSHPPSQPFAHPRQAQQMQFPPPDFTHPSFWLGQQGQGGSAVDGAAFGSPSAPSQGAGGAGSGGVSLSMLEMGNGASGTNSDRDELSGTGLGLQGSSFLPPHSTSHQMNVDPASMSWPGNLPTASAPSSMSDNDTYPPPSPTSTRGSKRPRHDHHNASASSLPGTSSAHLPHPSHPRIYHSNTAAASGATFSTHPALAQHELPLPPFDQSSDKSAHISHPASNDVHEDAFALPTPGSSFSAPGNSDLSHRRHFPRNSGSLRTGLYTGSTGSPSGSWSRFGSASTGSGGASRAGSGSAPGSGGASSASAEGSRKGSEHSQASGRSGSGSASLSGASRSGSGSQASRSGPGSVSGPTMLAQQVFPSPAMSSTNGNGAGVVNGTGEWSGAPGTGTIYEDLAGERRTPSAASAQSEDEPMAGPSMVAGGIAVREPGKVAGDGKKIVQKADKSCKKCRERRVRCDRTWPTCSRCKKRRETCEWTAVTNVDDIEEGGDAERIAELQAKVASLERQLKAANVSIKSTSALPAPPVPSSQSQPSLEASPPESNKSGPASLGAGFESVQALVQELWSTRLQLKDAEGEVLIQYLARQTTAVLDLGRANVNWRLSEPTLARSLTCHLLDAALHACCSKLPGIQPLAERIDEYKRNIDFLNPPQQCAVAVLCALGARASPHSQLLGIATVHLQDGTPSPPLYLYAGERREMACRQLEQRARELCWSHGFFNEPDLAQLDSMVGLVQLLIYEEVLPKQSRFFCRAAIGAYFDIRHDALERGDRTSRDPRIGPGTALFLADASISSACGRPSYITTGELDQYIISDGVKIPDFPGSELGDELTKILQRPLTQDKLVSALSTTCLWVAGCQRLFATLSTGRRPGVESTLPLLKNLWKLIDKVHNAIQELQQLFVSLSPQAVEGMGDDPFGLEHYVLMGVRYDSLLVDLVNLQHVYLMRNRNTPGVWNETENDPLLHAMREESILRVRKCLKLAAFYAQLYLQSQDKHLVHHMLMQLEMLPEWSIWANQRINSPGGPTSQEYEVTEAELNWFQQALELASYYNPKAAHRLAEFSRSRSHFSQHPQRGVEELLRGAPHPNPMIALQQQQQPLIEQQLSQNPRFFYDLPPHDVASLQHMSPNDDPQRFYNVAAAEPFVPNPNQLYVFNDYGVAADQGRLLSDQPPVPSLDFVQGHFTGQNWMAMSPPIQERNSMQKEYEHAGERLGGDSPEWMRNAGRSEEAS
ncbi:Depudecin biosynthesis cluster-specific transcription activator DEP6 [Rhodotorula toruloides]|nr:Depudecin biosynthesis cluster-specific transcription activator DEP6 [Rhodotorula toruloides]